MRYQHVIKFSKLITYVTDGREYTLRFSWSKPDRMTAETRALPVTQLILTLPDGQRIRLANEFWNRSGIPSGRAWRNYRNGKSRPIKQIMTDILAGIMTPNAKRLKRHLERQFTDRMNWNNYVTYWTIDHLIPAGWFNLNRLIEKKIYNSFPNLRPMPAYQNFARGAAMTLGEVRRFVSWSWKIAGSEAFDFALSSVDLEADFNIDDVPFDQFGARIG
jgi:hypothetical protein